MIIDLHIHSQSSDGALTVEEIVKEAKLRNIGFMSITDHDSIGCQEIAMRIWLGKPESAMFQVLN